MEGDHWVIVIAVGNAHSNPSQTFDGDICIFCGGNDFGNMHSTIFPSAIAK